MAGTLRVAGPAKEYILLLPPEAQQEIKAGLNAIEDQPLSGAPLPFPWVPGTMCHITKRYFITYRMNDDDIPEVASVTKMPSSEDIQQAFEQRWQAKPK